MTVPISFNQIISLPAVVNSKTQKIRLSNASLLFVICFEEHESRYYDLHSALNFFVIQACPWAKGFKSLLLSSFFYIDAAF